MSRASFLAVLIASAAPSLAHAQLADRYGPAPAADQGGAPAAATPFRGRMISWPGKSAAAPPSVEGYPAPQAYTPRQAFAPTRAYASHQGYAPPQGYARAQDNGPPQAYAPTRSYGTTPAEASSGRYASLGAPGPAAGRFYASTGSAAWTPPRAAPATPAPPMPVPESDGWRAVGAPAPSLAGAPTRSDLPSSIYAPAAQTPQTPPISEAARAAPPPQGGSAAQRYGYDPTQAHGVRFYSVHRPFGIKPDPAPIPPQFFTNTADLADPPGPLPTERTSSTSSSKIAVRAAADTGAN